jgi:molecular chaperone DnaK
MVTPAQGAPAVAFSLFDYFQKQGLRVVETALKGVLGKAAVYVDQDDHYRQADIQPAWSNLAPPIRLLLRKSHDHWSALFFEIRDRVFSLRNGVVELRPDASLQLAALLRQFYPPNAAPPEAAPPPSVTVIAGPPPKVKEDVAVGIDLGTTYSLVAHLDAQGRPVCIHNSHGDVLTPSAVLFDPDGAIVGKAALHASVSDPDKMAECVKRDMGAKAFRKKINGEDLPPEVISSLILRALKGDAERKLGRPVTKAVITVPAYFEETRRRATMDAGKLAGLDVLDIINEPTAAAIAYGYHLGFLDRGCALQGDKPLRVLVFDLGGGTFDVTIVEIKGTDFTALATDGDVSLGGKDWDERLIALAADRFQAQVQENPRDNAYSLQELSLSAESAKRTLTERKKAAVHINHLGRRLRIEVTRDEFEEATAALVERTRMTSEIVVRQAGVAWADIDRVLLVGGSTRMPAVRRMLRELTGKEPEASLSPDEAVAHGAALYAELLAPRSCGGEPAKFTMTNVNSHSLGVLGRAVSDGRKVNKIVIPRNSPLPRTVTKEFRTYRESQKSVVIKVLEGESDQPEVCTAIGTCAIHDLPAGLPVGWPITVSYTYEANGRLRVAASLKGHDASVTADFERENRLPDDDAEMWAQFIVEEDVPAE